MYRNEQGVQQDGQTAFRIAEKRYQLHKDQIFRNRGGRRISKGFVVRPIDLSGVLDLQAGGPLPESVTCHGVPSGMPPTAAAFTFAAHPGLMVVRNALPAALQRQLVISSLTSFCEPPNHTNHSRAYPGGLPGLWHAAQQGLRLQLPAVTAHVQGQQPSAAATAAAETASGDANAAGADTDTAAAAIGHAAGSSSEGDHSQPGSHTVSTPDGPACSSAPQLQSPLWGTEGSGPLADSLLRKLRWATLGPPYDWTLRKYLQNTPHMPLPSELRQLAVTLADLAAGLAGGSSSASDNSPGASAAFAGGAGSCIPPPTFCPNAALVNFYYEGDTLNGHIDDAEPNLDQPLVALSLGCHAIFLMGATSKDVPPTALLLQSGDAVVLSGQARRCYHGVPRVLVGSDAGADQLAPAAAHAELGGGSNGEGKSGGSSGGGGSPVGGHGAAAGWAGADREGGSVGDFFAPFAHHMQRCRINISIRDVGTATGTYD